METVRHLLAVYPHPDDETLGKAGAIAMLTKQGTPVTLICGTLGEMGRNMGKPFFANRETLPFIREKELRDACRVLGISELRLLGLRDKTLEFEDPDELANRIYTILQEIKPSHVVTYYPRHGVHPDHDALSAATIRAVAKMPKAERPIVYASPVTKDPEAELGPPDVVFDVSSVMDTKLEAMRAHKSQTAAMFAQMDQREPAMLEQFERNMSKERYWIYPVDDEGRI